MSSNVSPSAGSPSSASRIREPVTAGLVLVLVAGTVLRLLDFAYGRSLWVDEAMLALNVFARPFDELVGGLDLLQVAPALYLWLERVLFLVGGPSERWVRLPSLLTGIAVPFLAVPLARRLVHRAAALPVAGALALAPALIRYSNELKPYMLDCFGAVFLLLLTSRALHGQEARGRYGRRAGVATLALALLVLPFLSLPSVFVGAGVAAAFFLRSIADRGAIDRRTMLLTAAWIVGSGLSVLVARDPGVKAGMVDYWQGTFLWLGGANGGYIFDQIRGFAFLTLWDGRPEALDAWFWVPLFSVLLVAGGVRVWHENGPAALALLVVPIAVGLGASVLGQYPFAVRLWLWALPPLVILAVAGVFLMVPKGTTTRATVVALACVVVIVASRGRMSFYWARNPDMGQHARPVLEALEEAREAGEPVYVFARSAPAWHVYTTDWDGDLAPLRRAMELASPGGPAFINSSDMPPWSADQRDALTWEGPQGPVLLGRSSGLHIEQAGPGNPVDDEWAPSEVARLRRAATPCAWIFRSHVLAGESRAFVAELNRVGVQVDTVMEEANASAERVCFELPMRDPGP